MPYSSTYVDPRFAVVQANTAAKRAADVRAIDTGIEADAEMDMARRNEATAARQNAAATMGRVGTRAGGGRYRRRGLFNVGGSGLDRANSQAMVTARKKAAYAQLDAQEAGRQNAEIQNAWRQRVGSVQYFY